MNGSPNKLNERHKLIALATIAGWTNREIAEELGMHETRISIVKSSPQFKLLVHDLSKRRDEEGISNVVERITSFKDRLSKEWDTSLQKIIDVRDGTEVLGIQQLDAAKFLVRPAIETAFPRKVQSEEERTLKLVIEGADFSHLAKVIAEDMEDAELVSPQAPAQEPKAIRPVMPEDLEE